MIWQRVQTVAMFILVILNILNLLPTVKIPNIMKWVILLSLPILIIILLLPKFCKWYIKIKKLKKQNRIAATYFQKLRELVDRFIILIDLGRTDAIFRVTQDILHEIDKGDEVFYKYNLDYYLYKAQLDAIKSLKPNVDNLKAGICKLNFIIDSFCQMYVDRAYPYLIESSEKIPRNFKDNFNSTMSNLERLIHEFGDLCESAKQEIENIGPYGKFVIKKL